MSTIVSEDLLREVTRRLVELFQPEQVILFGSHAWGTPTAGSDIDVIQGCIGRVLAIPRTG